MKKIAFDKEAETIRKLRTNNYAFRTPENNKEEEHLINEIKHLDFLIKKKEKESI